MKQRWMIPGAMVLLALILAIMLVEGASLAQTVQADLVVTKTVNKPVVAPKTSVVYTVVFSNTAGTTVTVDSIVDTLPTGFEFVGLAPGSQCEDKPPNEVSLPEIRWDGPITVSASSVLTLCYHVFIPQEIPLSGTPYTNTAVATIDQNTYEAQSSVLVGLGEVSVLKEAAPVLVQAGEPVTYTITFNNSGYVTVPLEVVTDVLPAQISFAGMTAHSDVDVAPVGVTGTITWTGPFTIPVHGEFVVEFRADTPVTSDTLTLENKAWGRLGDGFVLSDSVQIEVRDISTTTVVLPMVVRNYKQPAFSAAKTANPTSVYNEAPGALVTYQVVFTNTGNMPGVLADIRDTLPTGFTFIRMMPGSDVSALPSGTTGQIVWTGPFTMTGGSSLKLIYEARATTALGTYENIVTATVAEGRSPTGLIKATVNVIEPFLLHEEFESPSSYWEPFLNYWRLNEQQWFYAPGESDDYSTALKHIYWLGVSDPDKGAHDALYMYKAPGAEQWTDYSVKARALMGIGSQFGLWFRGTYEKHPDLGGRTVTGYYFLLTPSTDKKMNVTLYQLRTDEECGDDCSFNYHFSNPIELVQVKGLDLLELGVDVELWRWYWLRVDVEGSRIRCYVDDILVIDYDDTYGTTFTQGTVGFFVYKAADVRFDHVTVTRIE